MKKSISPLLRGEQNGNTSGEQNGKVQSSPIFRVSVALVEVNGAAFAEMQNNATGTNAKCVLAKSEDVTEYITPDCTVILDPPRAGCDTKLLEKLIEVQPATVIYLSCNPITQARDIAILQDKYIIDQLQPYNFFPRTPHIENLAILRKV